MYPLRRSPVPVLGAAFGAILVVLAVMVIASDWVGRALVARHENEVQFAELLYGADRLQARISEQIDSVQDFLRQPSPLRLQLYRAAYQAVTDEMVALDEPLDQRPELAAAVARLRAAHARWGTDLGPAVREVPVPRDSLAPQAPRLTALADEIGDQYLAAVRDYLDRLERMRAENRRRGDSLADLFQLVVRAGGVVGALLVVSVGLVSVVTIRRSLHELAASRRAVVQAQEAVRRDVAERLHGEVQGKLLALELQLRQAAARILLEPAAAEEDVRAIIARLEVVRDTARAVSHQLHPAILRMGLPAALRSLRDGLEPAVVLELDIAPEVEARELRRSFGVPGSTAALLPDDVRLALYRVVQEAVNNAVRHGGVAEVTVRVWLPRPDQLAVQVQDRGRGLARGARTGLGLASLRGALEAVGGRLEVTGEPRGGTRVLGVVPIAPSTETHAAPPAEAAAAAR